MGNVAFADEAIDEINASEEAPEDDEDLDDEDLDDEDDEGGAEPHGIPSP